MAKPVVKFKTYRQTQRVGGKIYGVANLADPQIASVTMQEVIDYAKLHNYSAATLEALLQQVIAGVADLVARDGRPRNLSDLLKFEPVIKGTFANMEQTVTSAQKVIIRPRLLKEIRVNIASDAFSWQNENDTLSPEIRSVAPISDTYHEVDLYSVRQAILTGTGFGWTLAGQRLAPNGWDETCKFEVVIKPKHPGWPSAEMHFEHADLSVPVGQLEKAGFFVHGAGDEATDNAIALAFSSPADTAQCWYYSEDGEEKYGYDGTYDVEAGDIICFRFTRSVASGDTFTVEKSYTL